MKWSTLHELIGDAYIIAFSLFSLWLFQFFWRSGGIYLYEDNIAIRLFETAWAIGIGVTGVILFVADIVPKGKKLAKRIRRGR